MKLYTLQSHLVNLRGRKQVIHNCSANQYIECIFL